MKRICTKNGGRVLLGFQKRKIKFTFDIFPICSTVNMWGGGSVYKKKRAMQEEVSDH